MGTRLSFDPGGSDRQRELLGYRVVPIPYPITVEGPEVIKGITLLDRRGITTTEGVETFGSLDEIPSRGLTLLGSTRKSCEGIQRS